MNPKNTINPVKSYYDNGQIESEYYYNEVSQLHREDGPASILYYKNGNIKEMTWCHNGKFHNEDNPALIT